MCCEFFDKQLYYQSFLNAICYFGRRPSCSCLVMNMLNTRLCLKWRQSLYYLVIETMIFGALSNTPIVEECLWAMIATFKF